MIVPGTSGCGVNLRPWKEKCATGELDRGPQCQTQSSGGADGVGSCQPGKKQDKHAVRNVMRKCLTCKKLIFDVEAALTSDAQRTEYGFAEEELPSDATTLSFRAAAEQVLRSDYFL